MDRNLHMQTIDRKEWYASRDIPYREADKIAHQLESHYLYLGKALRGELIPSLLLETELVQLVFDIKRGRFPISQTSNRRLVRED